MAGAFAPADSTASSAIRVFPLRVERIICLCVRIEKPVSNKRRFPRTEINPHFLTLPKREDSINPVNGWPQSASYLRSLQNVDRFSPKLTVHRNSKMSVIQQTTAPLRTEGLYLQA